MGFATRLSGSNIGVVTFPFTLGITLPTLLRALQHHLAERGLRTGFYPLGNDRIHLLFTRPGRTFGGWIGTTKV